jgi:GT2 family glycosyltransferase
MPNPDISLIIPTRQRTAQLRLALESIRLNTAVPGRLEIVLVVDEDDRESLDFKFDGLRVVMETIAPGQTMGALNMAGYRRSSGEHVMLLNDDVVLRTHGWDEQALSAFQRYPDGVVLVHVNDLVFQDSLCIFPFLKREFCETLGGICPLGYRRYRIDDHIHNIFDLLALLGVKRRIFFPEIVFEHMNRSVDEVGQFQYAPNIAIQQLDDKLFQELLPTRKQLAIEAMRRIQDGDRRRSAAGWTRRLSLVEDSIAERKREHALWHGVRSAKTRVTVCVVSADTRFPHSRECLRAVKEYSPGCDLLVVDNQRSPDFNHSREMNRLIDLCRTPYLVLMDDDVFVGPGWLDGLFQSLEPSVGVVTPLHKDGQGRISYAGLVLHPDNSGRHEHIFEVPAETRRIQTLCSALMLVDMNRCGHIRLDEAYSKYFLDIDYGLRVWENGAEVVCSPHTTVTHLGGATMKLRAPTDLAETERRVWAASWVETGRLEMIRNNIWSRVPELAALERAGEELKRLLADARHESPGAFRERAERLLLDYSGYPAFRNYLIAEARQVFGDRSPIIPPDDDRLHEHSPEPVIPNAEVSPLTPRMPDVGARYVDGMARLGGILRARIQQFRHFAAVPSDPHPLFDSAYYLLHNPEAAGSGMHPFQHYLERGGFEGRNPHPLFDSAFYSSSYPGVASSGMNPLVHFLGPGGHEGWLPNPLFDTPFYLRENPDVAAAGINPLVHYVLYGAAEGRRPHPLFDPAYYLDQHPEVAAAGANVLAHFLEFGCAQNCSPHPLFDPAFYLRQKPAAPPPANLLAHFLSAGARLRLSPHALFDTDYYLREHPEVAQSGRNPLEHFLRSGAALGWKPHPLFDTGYYLARNPELASSGVNPLEHFVRWGARESRDPNPNFDVRYYVEQNPDVAASGINPLSHFVTVGASQGRKPHRQFHPLPHSLAAGGDNAPHASAPAISEPSEERLPPISVVIPTHNRAGILEETLFTSARMAGGCELEFIVVDDGSSDDTPRRLEKLVHSISGLRWQRFSVPVGPAAARNAGAAAATHDLILFMGDDIRPLNPDFFRTHASAHEAAPGPEIAVLGKVVWPRGLDITPTMMHAQGRGGQQFEFESLRPNTFTDWQHFYTANISVKKALVNDWIAAGFDVSFRGAAFEDLEFAYRLTKHLGLRIFYDPTALGSHHHRYGIQEFIGRQHRAGKALSQLFHLHPELTGSWGSEAVLEACRNIPLRAAQPSGYAEAIEGLKAYARGMEERRGFGSQPWHEEFLSALLELSLLEGLLSAQTPPVNAAAAQAAMLGRFSRRMAQAGAPELEALRPLRLAVMPRHAMPAG